MVDLVGIWLAHALPWRPLRSEGMDFDAEHMLERSSLLLLIALGETILGTGRAVSAVATDTLSIIAAAVSLASSTALFSVVFGSAGRFTRSQLSAAGDHVHIGRHAVHGMLAMSAGLIALAVANDSTIAEPRRLRLGLGAVKSFNFRDDSGSFDSVRFI